jgi:hypothetical protein
MISQEMMQASHQELIRQAESIQREAKALTAVSKSRPRRLPLPRLRGLLRPSFNSGSSRVAPAP